MVEASGVEEREWESSIEATRRWYMWLQCERRYPVEGRDVWSCKDCKVL
jgi:hypothetical protein